MENELEILKETELFVLDMDGRFIWIRMYLR